MTGNILQSSEIIFGISTQVWKLVPVRSFIYIGAEVLYFYSSAFLSTKIF